MSSIEIIIFVVVTLLLIGLFCRSVKKRRSYLMYIHDVWVGDIPDVNVMQGRSIYRPSPDIIRDRYYYKKLIDYCLQNTLFEVKGASRDSIFYDSILATKIINDYNFDIIEVGDYVVIAIKDNVYLQKVYRLSENSLYYQEKDTIVEVQLSDIISKVEFIFSKTFLEKVRS